KVSVSLKQRFCELNVSIVTEKILSFGKGKASFKNVKLNSKLLTLAGMHDFKGLLNELYEVILD
ncbi:9994_t:CDS:2, partial [Dentiscutata erythropus]